MFLRYAALGDYQMTSHRDAQIETAITCTELKVLLKDTKSEGYLPEEVLSKRSRRRITLPMHRLQEVGVATNLAVQPVESESGSESESESESSAGGVLFVSATKIPVQSAGGALAWNACMRVQYKSKSI